MNPFGGPPPAAPGHRGELHMEQPKEWTDKLAADRARRAASSGWATVVGVDLSYSGTGDQAAFVAVSMQKGTPWNAATLYVRDVFSGRREIGAIRPILTAWSVQFPGAEFASFVSGTEAAVLGLLEQEWIDSGGIRHSGVTVSPMLAVQSKRSRAAATEEKWNQGKVIVPSRASWAKKFIKQVQAFSGRDGDDDDVIDALVSGVEYLRNNAIDLAGVPLTARRTGF